MALPRFTAQLHMLITVFMSLPLLALSSLGDRSVPFQNFLRTCLIANCSSDAKLANFELRQPQYMQYLRWHCQAECKYESMWNTVDYFQWEGWAIPQFNGKWPFLRILGIQEPASVVFSILNGLANVYMIWKMRQLLPCHAPMYRIWQGYAVVGVLAWIGSTIFHARDLLWTEYLDYFAAFALTMTGLWTACMRIFAFQRDSVRWLIAVPITSIFLYIYITHIYFLAFIRFDYGYNMKVNVMTSACTSVLWISWSLYRIKRQPYLKKTLVTIILGCLLVLLELLDFAPLLWTFDAHSLWHAGTSPLPILFFSFCIEDSLFLLEYSASGEFKKGV